MYLLKQQLLHHINKQELSYLKFNFHSLLLSWHSEGKAIILTDTDYTVHLPSGLLFSSYVLIIQAFCFV